MLINLRNALMAGKRLPYDAEVEFLESTGTQWIDTGVIGSLDSAAEITAQWTGISGFAPLFGARNSYNSRGFAAYNGSDQGYLWCFSFDNTFSYDWARSNVLSNDGLTHNIRIGYNCRVDNWSATWSSAGQFTTSNTLLVFAWNQNGTITAGSYRVYSCKIWDNGVLVRDYIPVRVGTVGYLYDRVSGKLFGNAGTGDFVVGPDVVPVEYIESHGTEWIDTGTLIEMTDRVDCTFELLAYGNATLAGGRIDASTSSWAMWAYTDTGRCIRFDLLSNGYGNVVQSITPTIGREYKVSKIGTRNIVDGVIVNSNTSVAYTPSRPCYLFAMNNGGTASFIGNLRIKDFSIGSKLKYRPVRVGTEGAMMDVLTRKIYRNAGTGAFTYGNDLKYPIPAE